MTTRTCERSGLSTSGKLRDRPSITKDRVSFPGTATNGTGCVAPRSVQRAARQTGAINPALLFTAVLALAGLAAAVALVQAPTPYDSPSASTGSSMDPATAQPVLLSLVGSNTIGSDLAPTLAKAYMNDVLGAVRVEVRREPKEHRTVVEGYLPGATAPSSIQILATGSGFAFEALKNGVADIGMSSRTITAAEEEQLASLGNMRDRKSEQVLGLDGLAVVVHPSNPVTVLTLDQIKRIFNGRIKQWSTLGGAKRPIHRYSRNRESGTFASFVGMVNLDRSALSPDITYIVESSDVSDTVAGDPDGIGFIALPYIGKAKAVRVAATAGPGFPATRTLVYREDYPLSRRLYLYAPPNPSNRRVGEFLEFAQSPAGQKLVDATGFVGRTLEPLDSAEDPHPLPKQAPKAYTELAQTADPLPVSIRFKPGSTEPDSKAWNDLPRLVQVLLTPQYRNREVVLAAFRNRDTVPGADQAHVQDAAIAELKAELERKGLQNVKVADFGPALPVAADSTPEGREKNRRVEVWLSR
ncbi:substrate-binding domain-containing protein [Methylolobus aquaticus]